MLIAEVRTRAFLASLVPIIVNTVLNEHQLVLDIVAFVQLGDFPRSRLGEKQRGKILANWVSRKMRTIAQFGIRDPDAEGSVSTIGPEHMGRRESGQSGMAGGSSLRKGGLGGASSLRHMESLTNMPLAEEPDAQQMSDMHLHSQRPVDYEDRLSRSESRNDLTPTRETPKPLMVNTTLDYSPVEPQAWDTSDQLRKKASYGGEMRASHADYGSWETFDPYAASQQQRQQQQQQQQYQEQHQPTAYTRGYDDEDDSPVEYHSGFGPSGGGGGGLRVANRASSGSEDGSWERDALRSMNLGSAR